ncbi:MAG: hypothetical protein E6I65_08015 [Chloroflexi bacterium]|nr:MAG: hypothetical protein E6I65_08015 [Chloroflexota bacterium]
MSSARARVQAIVGRAIRGILWTALFAVLAAGGAGLIAEASHTPGGPSRAELTSVGDTALGARLDQATDRLRVIAADVERLADDAKTALEEIASSDPTKLQDSLAQGSQVAATINTETNALLGSLAGLPGDEPDAVLRYSNDTLVRRAAILAALDAAASLNAHWLQVTGRAIEATQLTTLIAEHDEIVLDAAAKGRARKYGEAATTLDQAILAVVSVKEQRTKLIAGNETTVLDEWIQRNGDYDQALRALYVALDQSGGRITVKVQLARRDERDAFEQLPPDRRTIIVIVAEVARGGLTQAVLAIEDARGRIDDALAEAGAAPTGSPTESDSPTESGSPGDSGSPEATDSASPPPG